MGMNIWDEIKKLNPEWQDVNVMDMLAPTTGTGTEAVTRMFPITGEAWTVDDVKKDVQGGNYGSAALGGLLGMLPFGGTIKGLTNWKKMALTGNQYGSGGRNKLKSLLGAVGESADGSLNSPSDLAGVVNEYMAATPHRQQILADAQSAKEAGKLTPQKFQALRRGFASADKTTEAGDQIAAHIDASLPARAKLKESTWEPPKDTFLDLSLLRADPSEVMGTQQRSLLLGVPNTFDIDTFTSRFSPDRVRAMHGAAQSGMEIGGETWYNMAPVYQKLVDTYGADEGAAKFYEWAKGNASLSPRSGVVDQTIRESQMKWFYDKFGRLPTKDDMKQYPDMFGHLAHDIHVKGMQDGIDGPLIKTGERPKVGSYYENYTGNWLPGTMDVHHFTAANLSNQENQVIKALDKETGKWVPKIGPDGNVVTNVGWTPDAKYYNPLELATMEMAARHGVMPAQDQALVWTGLARSPEFMIGGKTHAPRTAEPYAQIFDRVIRESAAMRGVSPEEHFRNVFDRIDYLTRPAGAAKKRNLKLLDAGE